MFFITNKVNIFLYKTISVNNAILVFILENKLLRMKKKY